MSVIRIIHNRENPFVQLNKETLWDENLSLKATGLWARCMSRPDNWRFNIKELASKSKEGRRAIDSAIHELIENGYALRIEHWEKSDDGKFKTGGVEYVFFEFPATQEDKDKATEEFKKFYRHRGFGNCRNGDRQDGDCRNSNLLISTYKDIEKKEENRILSSDRSETELASPPRSEISFSFDKFRFENIETDSLETWKTLYPAIKDIDLELKKMTEWIRCNLAKAKSRKNWRKFVTTWLSRNNETLINKEAARSQGYSNEIDRRRKDENGNPIRSQYAELLPCRT